MKGCSLGIHSCGSCTSGTNAKARSRALFKLIGTIRKQRYDHVINAQRFFSTGLMTALSGGKETIGYDKNPLSFLFSRKVKHQIPESKALREHP